MENTGDYINYHGIVDKKYEFSGSEWFALFKEFSLDYYNEYKQTNPKIHVMFNPRNEGEDQCKWVIKNCPDCWIKTSTLGKGYQLNDEIEKKSWLYKILNNPLNGEYVRSRSEILGSVPHSGWWNNHPYRNMFAMNCYALYWGLDWSNQGGKEIVDDGYDSTFNFFNRYAGEKNPLKSDHAFCALKDGLDAADTTRFSQNIFGAANRYDTLRYRNIVNSFASFGAKLEDAKKATLSETDNLDAKGINDVGWNIFPGNYERYLHQINAAKTSVGYWNVESADANSMYGRFARGFDYNSGKNDMYFDINDKFLSNLSADSNFNVVITITYLDKGNGKWKLFYDSRTNGANKLYQTITNQNTGYWKTFTATISDGYFGNNCENNSDFFIKNAGTENVIFSLIEVAKINLPLNKSSVIKDSIDSVNTMLTVTPNPVNNRFTVSLKNHKKISSLLIYNSSGMLVAERKGNYSIIQLLKSEISNLPGLYYLSVISENKMYKQTILVN